MMPDDGGSDVKVAYPLFQEVDGGASPTLPLHTKELRFEVCPWQHAVECNAAWHSRLPVVDGSFMKYSFLAQYQGRTYAVAMWSNPTARMVPPQWIELRRMACATECPRHTASRFLGWMVRWLQAHHPEHERCISYQDTGVHQGTIYKAAGWTAATVEPRIRSIEERQTRVRANGSLYRPCTNGFAVDQSPKIRWEKRLT